MCKRIDIPVLDGRAFFNQVQLGETFSLLVLFRTSSNLLGAAEDVEGRSGVVVDRRGKQQTYRRERERSAKQQHPAYRAGSILYSCRAAGGQHVRAGPVTGILPRAGLAQSRTGNSPRTLLFSCRLRVALPPSYAGYAMPVVRRRYLVDSLLSLPPGCQTIWLVAVCGCLWCGKRQPLEGQSYRLASM